MDRDDRTSTSTPTDHTPGASRPIPAQIELFGFPATPAHVEVISRAPSWRVSRALLSLAVAWGAIPIVFWLPPHFPWVLGAFVLGIYFAWKHFTEHHTMTVLRGSCPKCAAPQTLEKPVRFRTPFKLSCAQCHHDLYLVAEVEGRKVA
jgi:hypothetical protein